MTIVNNLSELKTGIENGERNFKAGNKRTEIAMNAISHIPIIKLPKERLTSAGICAACPPVAPIILAGRTCPCICNYCAES